VRRRAIWLRDLPSGAMIARAYIGTLFVVWGTGERIRNWSYIDDIVSGTP
jgi:dTDP-D-glucose 4,6-dehydratase